MRSKPAVSVDWFVEHALHWAILAFLLVFTYARFFEHPYKGFDLDVNGRIIDVFVQGSPDNPLLQGDRLIRIGALSWADFQADYLAEMFDDTQPGDVVPLVVERAGSELVIPWTYPGVNPEELIRYALSGFWLGYFYWTAGMMTAIHLRPKGEAWRLAVAFNYFNAVGSMFGGYAQFNHLFYSALLVRVAVWIGVPLYLHFHWVWPRPLGRLPAAVVWGGYLAGAALALCECFRILPPDAYLFGLAFAIVGSLLLLLLHALRQPVLRSQLRWLLVVAALALFPLLGYVLIGSRMAPGMTSILGSIGLPMIPLAYFAAIHRRQLGDLEIRINRIVTIYAVLVVQGLVVLPLITLVALRWHDPAAVIIIAAVTGILGTIVGVVGYPALQGFLERHTFGMPLTPRDLLSHYAVRMTTSSSLPRLEALLKDEILPSLLIRQFAFLRIDQDRTSVLFAVGVTASELPDAAALPELWKGAGRCREAPPAGDTLPYPWIRLVMALGVEDDLVGAWLLGRRDPDDQYTASEIALIRSLANQTAIALSNIIQTERVRELYQANVRRTEEERLQLAHALHDRVLNQLAALLMRLEDPSVTPAVLKSFEEFSTRVREIVADLRPPMLTYGLKPALAELVEALAERPPQEVSFSTTILEGECRYPPAVELHLFRIAQESCENALHHAHATKVTISGSLEPGRAEIEIEDDGMGFEMPGTEALGHLIAQKHFGLAGLIERANLIGGSVQIRTAPGKGTRIKATWKAKPTGALPHITS